MKIVLVSEANFWLESASEFSLKNSEDFEIADSELVGVADLVALDFDNPELSDHVASIYNKSHKGSEA